MDTITAREWLTQLERQLGEKIRERNRLNEEVQSLETRAKSLRDQLQETNGEGSRQPRGANFTKIKEYLSKLPENKGARMIEIHKATGVSVSSTSFTLKNKKNAFAEDNGVWKLK